MMGTLWRVAPVVETGRSASFCLLTLLLLALSVNPVTPLRDDWYGFASFEDASEWQYSYYFTCSYKLDLFREPREYSQRNNLQGRRELHTPVSFRSKNTVPALSNTTLHIYNNPGIRKSFSVSYGFQRNKECLHGQDADCIVFPEIGRVRALVVQAERFGSEKQDLNFVKDNFLIEKPERFVTILNGGSHLERKFYEAVFLGGYTVTPKRTSHQIDGKKYPLEIYMYFIDETVASVSLSTILVVLVEESERDNVHIKPVVSTVENQLYDAERRFLENHKEVIRRQRLYHQLKATTYYDVYDTGNNEQEGKPIVQDSLASSVEHESIFTRYVEPFEKMQALEAELFFLLEDLSRVDESFEQYAAFMFDFAFRKGNALFPNNFTEYQMLALTTLYRGFTNAHDIDTTGPDPTCGDFMESQIRKGFFFNNPPFSLFKDVSQVPTGEHLDRFIDLCTIVCEHFLFNFTDQYLYNYRNESEMMQIDVGPKYQMIHEFIHEREYREELNEMVFTHFHGTTGNNSKYHNYKNKSYEKPDYADDQQPHHIVDGIYELIMRREKIENYKVAGYDLSVAIEEVVNRMDYTDQQAMEQVIRYLKRGSKQNDLKHYRAKIHEDIVERETPVQRKKRTLVEFGGMEISEEKIREYEQLDPIRATVNEAFQISWLIPQDGGYYYYAGSSPIPPCFRAQNVIVFKKPISMSRRQIEILTRVPSSFDRAEDIRYTTPYVHDTKFEVDLSGIDTEKSRVEEVEVPIYNQKRNHLFLGHDGVHKNAVEEWDNRKSKKNAATLLNTAGLTIQTILNIMISIYPLLT